MIKIQSLQVQDIFDGICPRCQQPKPESPDENLIIKKYNGKRAYSQCKDCHSFFRLSSRIFKAATPDRPVRFISPSEFEIYVSGIGWNVAIRAWEISRETFRKYQREENPCEKIKNFLPDSLFEI